MEIKKAIKILDYIAASMLDDVERGGAKELQAYEVMMMAMAALQEKLERENGCECCNHHVPVKNFAKEYSIEVDDLEVSLWEDLKCLATIKINYCPMCGRRLEHIGEATNMVEGE